MTLFRRGKIADATRGNKLDYRNNKSTKEDVLQGQVDDLKEEMERLGKRLVAMQAKVQNTGTISPTTANFPTPLFSLRPGIHQEASNEEIPLIRDQFIRKQPIQKKKGREDSFVPREIDFVSNDLLYHGKNSHRPDIRVSNIFLQDEAPPPIQEIETKRKTGNIFSIDSSYSINKVKTLQHCKHIHQSTLKVFGDAESITSSQRSTSTSKNGRKVRRTVRKVRAAPPTKTTPNAISMSRVSGTRDRDETKSSLSPTICSHRIGLSTKRPASLNKNSRIKLDTAFIDDPYELSICAEPSTHNNRINNEDDTRTCSRQTRTSPFVQHHKEEFTANSILLDKIQEKFLNIALKETEEQPESPDKNISAQLHESLLEQTHCDIFDQPDTEIVLHRPDRDVTDEVKSRKFFSTSEPVGCIQPKSNLERPGTSRTTAFVYSNTSNSVLDHAQINAKLDQVQNSVANSLDSTPGLHADIRGEVESNQIDKLTQQAPNPKSDLLSDIRSGIKLNKVINSAKTNLQSTSNFHQSVLQEDVQLSRVETSAATICRSTANFLELKTAETSPIGSQNPKNAILEGIKAGVKLKQVDRSSLQDQKKKHETPMGALLAKIQERKQECLRQEHPYLENPEQSLIDW